MPVYNDWPACGLLLARLDAVFAEGGLEADVLLVDDGSNEPPPEHLEGAFTALARVELLPLKANVGHQRAICLGLAYADAYLAPDIVIVMDSDGEDDPSDVLRLLKRHEAEGGRKIVFAERRKRSESWLFRLGYFCFRWLHVLLTGYPVRVGNFSVVPKSSLARLVIVPAMWSHYAAAVFVSGLPYCAVPTSRAKRLSGSSKMSWVGLITHGLSAISVFSERMGVRLLLACAGGSALLVAALVVVVVLRMWTSLAIPGWATYAAGVLTVLLFQLLTFALLFCFMILNARNRFNFLPARDFGYYVSGEKTLYARLDPSLGRDGYEAETQSGVEASSGPSA